MSELEVIQGSDAWKAARLGRLTASRIADAMARTKSGWGASRANYCAELVVERLTGQPAASFVTVAMQWGLDTEAEAKAAYAFHVGMAVEEVGFVPHPTIAMSGASPDGLVGEDGLVEIKCPHTATHIDTLLDEPVPAKYILQILWQLACTGRKWCDFVSYDPRLPPEMRLYVWRLERNDELIADLEDKVRDFLGEVDGKVDALTARFLTRRAAA